jgi:hypothetical protein
MAQSQLVGGEYCREDRAGDGKCGYKVWCSKRYDEAPRPQQRNWMPATQQFDI